MPDAFTNALLQLENSYDKYKKAVEEFKKYLEWNIIARSHIELYHNIITSTKTLMNNDATTVTIAKSSSKSSASL
jgi:hypothetical protein